MAGAQFDKLPVVREAIERVLKRIALFALHAEFAHELFERGARMWKSADVLDDTRLTEARRRLRMSPHVRMFALCLVTTYVASSLETGVLRKAIISGQPPRLSPDLSRPTLRAGPPEFRQLVPG